MQIVCRQISYANNSLECGVFLEKKENPHLDWHGSGLIYQMDKLRLACLIRHACPFPIEYVVSAASSNASEHAPATWTSFFNHFILVCSICPKINLRLKSKTDRTSFLSWGGQDFFFFLFIRSRDLVLRGRLGCYVTSHQERQPPRK